MIDWLTLRFPLKNLAPAIEARFRDALGMVSCCDSDGVVQWQKPFLDLDALRSDTTGFCWSVQRDAEQEYLTIGASPASLEHNNNVFGSGDIRHCSRLLLRAAAVALNAILPSAEQWSCRRIDVTENYLFSSSREVKQWLRALMVTDSGRHKGSTGEGDTVLWNKGSSLRKGKAYHKGPQLNYLLKKGKCLTIDEWQLDVANRLGRLELTIGSRWFRRFYEDGGIWWNLTIEDLQAQHLDYFGRMWGGKMEVADMGRLLEELEKIAPSKGQALAAHRTWALIKSIGMSLARDSMPRSTFFRHQSLLRAAGLSDADLCAGNVLPFARREVVIANPVTSWEELRRIA
ncbi:MAG: phage/plasmid replication protein, II/X family [Burkholderiales bacterium]